MSIFKLVITGVGEQGTLLASRLLAQSAIKLDLSVKIGETYGMAQKGGPDMSHLQIGNIVNSPQLCPGEVDVLLGFEEGEAVRRGVIYLKKGGLALVNSRRLPPVEVISGITEYSSSERLMAVLSKVTEHIISFDATALAEEAGDPITTNIVMIGALCASGCLSFSYISVVELMQQTIKPVYYDTNMKAYELGKNALRKDVK